MDQALLPHELHNGTGPVLVFLNSLGTTSRMWDRTRELLPGRAALTIELPGHFTGSVSPFSFDDIVESVAAVIRQTCPSPVVICGVSLGGSLAVALAARHAALTSGIVVINAPTHSASPEFWLDRADIADRQGMEGFAAVLADRWFLPGVPSTLVESSRADLLSLPAAGYAQACRAIAGLDVRDDAPLVSVPTVVLSAESDTAISPSDSADFAAGIPSAVLVRTPGAHLLPIEAPEAVVDALARVEAIRPERRNGESD